MGTQVFLVDFDICRADFEQPSARHGIPSVRQQVHENLLHLSFVRFHKSEGRIRFESEDDVFPDQAPEQWMKS
jgi:hypothetical protein